MRAKEARKDTSIDIVFNNHSSQHITPVGRWPYATKRCRISPAVTRRRSVCQNLTNYSTTKLTMTNNYARISQTN